MSNIDKHALREAAVRAGGAKWQYMRATQHSKAYITDDKGSTVVNCTDGDVPAKCAGFLESANPAAVLALLDELEAKDKRIAELEAREKSLRTVGVMSQKAFQRLEGRESRFIALWPRHEIYLPRKRPDDGVIVYARVAGAGKGEAS